MAVKAKKISKAGALMQRVKQQIAKSGNARKGTFYVPKDGKARLRFLEDWEDGREIPWHRKWNTKSNAYDVDTPCLAVFGKDCPFCGSSEIRTQVRYVWQVWNYENGGERQVLCYAANQFSPLPGIIAQQEARGTITAYDFVITRNGEGRNVSYGVATLPDKNFRVDGVRLLNDVKLMKLIWDAFGTGSLDDYPDADDEIAEDDDDEDTEDDEEEEDDEDSEDSEDSEDEDEEEDSNNDEEEEEERPRRRAPVAKKKPANTKRRR